MKPAARLPATVRIGESVWTVELTDDPLDSGKLGMTTMRASNIQLARDQSASSTRDTLLHEVLHALCYESGMSHAMGIDGDDEERMIRVLTPMLLAVLRHNPTLLAFLGNA